MTVLSLLSRSLKLFATSSYPVRALHDGQVVRANGHRALEEVFLLICFDGASLLVLTLLASFDPFKVVSNRTGKVESYWICLDKINKQPTQSSGWCCVR